MLINANYMICKANIMIVVCTYSLLSAWTAVDTEGGTSYPNVFFVALDGTDMPVCKMGLSGASKRIWPDFFW